MKLLKFVLAGLLTAGSGAAQSPPGTGFPPYGSFENGRFDVVNRQNLNFNFGIPVVSRPARGMDFSLALNYNSLIWKRVSVGSNNYWQPYDPLGVQWGWRKRLWPETTLSRATGTFARVRQRILIFLPIGLTRTRLVLATLSV